MTAPTKIAILGGGMSALAAAYEIVKRSEPGEYEITVYQIGWRLGGKLATGRNYKIHDRIEEHGIHVLFGSYENVFYTLRRALADIGVTDWQDLFEQRSTFTAMERANGWRPWALDFPAGRDLRTPAGQPCYPGDALFADSDSSAVPEMVNAAIDWLIARINQHLASHGPLIRILARWIEAHLLEGKSAESHAHIRHKANRALRLLHRYHVSHWWGLHLLKWIPCVSEARDGLRRLWIVAELALVGIVGLRRAAGENQSFADLDDQDLREWLDSNALLGNAISAVTRDSSVLRMIYELIFAYREGDVNQPALAAGTGLRAVLRLFMDYRGSFVWVMKRGSETVVTPMYKALVKHGVKFEFFHRIDELVAGEDDIERVRMSIQAQTEGPYDPLYKSASWPATPKYQELKPGSGLENGDEFNPPLVGKNPEFDETRAKPVGSKEIEFGRHFDKLILALPPEELKLRANFADDAQWQAMLGGLKTTVTAGVQLWLTRTTEQLGWRNAMPATVGTYAPGLPDWIDLYPTIGFENWPENDMPASVAYFVGTIPEPTGGRDVRVETDKVRCLTRAWLERNGRVLWPNAFASGGGFDWRVLYDDTSSASEARLHRQFFRMNMDRSERYTLSLPGTMKTRLGSHDCRYGNLFLCGDWTDNGLNVGAVEAAVMSGRQAARALLGRHFIVYGESMAP